MTSQTKERQEFEENKPSNTTKPNFKHLKNSYYVTLLQLKFKDDL